MARIRPTRRVERAGVNALRALLDRHDLLPQEIDGAIDHGEDLFVYLTRHGSVTGHKISVQVKSGKKYRRKSGYAVPVGHHGNPWRDSSTPVVGVVYDEGIDKLFWVNLTEALRENDSLSWIRVPSENELTDATMSDFVAKMEKYCGVSRRPSIPTSPRPALKRPILLLATGIVAVLVLAAAYYLGGSSRMATENARPFTSSPSTAMQETSPQPSTPETSSWAAEIEGKCRRMEPTFESDLEAMQAVDDNVLLFGSRDEVIHLGSVLGTYSDHYAELSRFIHDVELPSRSPEAARKWRDLFDDRGAEMEKASTAITDGGYGGRLVAASHFTEYGRLNDTVLAQGKQLGIESCP